MTPKEASHQVKDLARLLRALPVQIDSVAVDAWSCEVPSYRDGPRPSSRVALAGAGCAGEGEHVGWSKAAHQSFRLRTLSAALRGGFTVESLSRYLSELFLDPYDRAALEAAAIDLALRQAQTSAYALLGVAPRPARYVVSIGPCEDPRPAVARELASGAPGLKIDVDSHWSDDTYRDLAATGRVHVLDFKRSGTPFDHQRAHTFLPTALLEDPLPGELAWQQSLWRHVSLDGPITSVRALEGLATPFPAAVNIKPARMGGVLEAIDAIAWCRGHEIDVYLGGMFEIGAGRRQLLTLAALFSPDGPNDIAPIATRDRPAERPGRLEARADGSGLAARVG